jgi:hypothetical protein
LDLKGGFYIEIGEARGNKKKVSNWKVKRRRSEKHGLNVFFWRQILYCEIDEEKQKSQTKM